MTTPNSTRPAAFSIAEACERLNVGRSTAYRLMASGRLPARKIAGRTVVLATDLEAFLDNLPPAYESAQAGE